jgi:hypothetical protein
MGPSQVLTILEFVVLAGVIAYGSAPWLEDHRFVVHRHRHSGLHPFSID